MDVEIDGQTAYAYTGGKPFDATLPCVIFIHGAENDHTVWTWQSRWFANHGYSVLAVDLPGHGRSGGAALTSIEALADWIGALIAKVDAGTTAGCSVVGHSMGSLTALECAVRFPDRIARIALVGTAVPMPVSDTLLNAARDKEAKAIGMINDWSHSPRGTIGGNHVPGMWLLGASLRLMERQRPGILHTDLAACNAYKHGLEAAALLHCPTLIISGNRDLMTSPKAATKLADVIPPSCKLRAITLQGTGHALMGEQPDAVLDTLRDFIPKP